MSCFYHRLVLEGVFFKWRVYGVASFTSSISVLGWNMIFVLRRYQVLYEGSRLFPPCLGFYLSPDRSAYAATCWNLLSLSCAITCCYLYRV
ncbi:hypothetical protein BJX65DRAFT_158434 [Aspergillus insuetus]